jgi:hypothetical protein
VLNPYHDVSGQWIRGSFHGHTAEYSECASVPLLESVEWYRSVGARFMAITDHNHVTDLAEICVKYPDMVFLQGFEHSRGLDMLFVGRGATNVVDSPLDRSLASARELLTVVCHPDPRGDGTYWSVDSLRELGTRPDGIEAYNGHYGVELLRKSGCRPRFTSFWDSVLTAGIRVWGYANDDLHDAPDFGNAYNMVNVRDLTAEAILSAAKRGCCYGSTGLHAKSIQVAEGVITVEVDAECDGRFVGPGGRALTTGRGTCFKHAMTEASYVRFEGAGDSGEIFLQPVFNDCAGITIP